jgi:2-desacetyl-2-hydroxyethyl bacteriochlorophyllide A dehydrogenase
MAEAIWFSAPRRVELRREDIPPVGAHDVRVRAIVSGVSAGSELLVYRGEAPPGLAADLPTVAGSFSLPMKFGYASVGWVVEAGSAVERPAVGDLVFVLHPHQTEYVVPAGLAVGLPRGLAPETGVFTANLETAVTVVLDAHPRLSEAALVIGQGVLGLLITMLLRRAGAEPVITAEVHAPRRAASISAGAHHALPPGADLPDAVRALTAGRGADVVIEASGNPAALQSCVDAAAFAGTIVVASWYGRRTASIDLGSAFHRRRIRMVSSQVSTIDPGLSGRWDRARRTALVTDLLCRMPLAGLVSHRFPFRDAASAYDLLDRASGEALQVVLDYV